MAEQHTPTAIESLLEAVDTVLEQAPCDCSSSMRYDRGEHLSGCPLFDLNLARAALQTTGGGKP